MCQNYFLWDETIAERGSDEIGSVLYKWVMANYEGNFDHLQVIMDNCAGKKEVHFEFMVSGHSYLPCNRGFSVIEKACKRK